MHNPPAPTVSSDELERTGFTKGFSGFTRTERSNMMIIIYTFSAKCCMQVVLDHWQIMCVYRVQTCSRFWVKLQAPVKPVVINAVKIAVTGTVEAWPTEYGTYLHCVPTTVICIPILHGWACPALPCWCGGCTSLVRPLTFIEQGLVCSVGGSPLTTLFSLRHMGTAHGGPMRLHRGLHQ